MSKSSSRASFIIIMPSSLTKFKPAEVAKHIDDLMVEDLQGLMAYQEKRVFAKSPSLTGRVIACCDCCAMWAELDRTHQSQRDMRGR